jgi:hypothetical protein
VDWAKLCIWKDLLTTNVVLRRLCCSESEDRGRRDFFFSFFSPLQTSPMHNKQNSMLSNAGKMANLTPFICTWDQHPLLSVAELAYELHAPSSRKRDLSFPGSTFQWHSITKSFPNLQGFAPLQLHQLPVVPLYPSVLLQGMLPVREPTSVISLRTLHNCQSFSDAFLQLQPLCLFPSFFLSQCSSHIELYADIFRDYVLLEHENIHPQRSKTFYSQYIPPLWHTCILVCLSVL